MHCLGPLLYALAWVSFGVGHSVLASAPGRAWLARHARSGDRLVYNLLAGVHLAVVLGLGAWLMGSRPAYGLPRAVHAIMAVAVLLGIMVLAKGGRSYDLARFLGLSQLRAGQADAAIRAEPLATGGANALVRHPLYLGLLLILWGLAFTPLAAATALWATIYILIGIRFEERKLVRMYGAAYAAYRARVPMLIPWPRRG